MRCEVTDPASLGSTERARWHSIQQSVPPLKNPFFTYEFTAIVASARPDVHVGVFEESGSIAGFLPFQRDGMGLGRPVGGKLSDYHGLIAETDPHWDARELLSALGLRSYSFDHLAPVHDAFRPFVRKLDASPFLDLSRGYKAYREGVRAARLGGPQEAEMKRRRIERQIGNVHFELHERDPVALRSLLRWKSLQYRRTHGFDPLSLRWVVEVIERVHAAQTPSFAGVLSCLYVDDRLVSTHLGLRSGSVLHSWFPAYDTSFAKYSPGLVLLLALAEAAAASEVRILDLGKGPESYKRRFTAESFPVAVGSVERGPLASVGFPILRASWSAVLASPLYERAHRLHRRLQFR